jgi:hypothetical protein
VIGSIYLAIYNGKLSTNMPNKVTAAVVAAGLPETSVPQMLRAVTNGTTAAISAVPGANAAIVAAARAGQKSAWAASFSTVYLSTIAFGASALIIAWFATDISEFMTSFVNKTVQQGKQQQRDEDSSSSEKV